MLLLLLNLLLLMLSYCCGLVLIVVKTRMDIVALYLSRPLSIIGSRPAIYHHSSSHSVAFRRLFL